MIVLGERMRRWSLPELEKNGRLIVALPIGFFSLFLLGNRIQLWLCSRVLFDCPEYWPVSVLMLRQPPNIGYPNRSHLLVAVGAFLIFFIAAYALRRFRYRFALVLLFGTILVLGSNLTQGVQFGFERPIEGMGEDRREYYNDAEKIDSPVQFMRDFNLIQVDLLTHSHTHPPGAVLIFYYLDRVLGSTILIAVTIAVASVAITGIYLRKLLAREIEGERSRYLVFLFLLIPAIQIYFAASLDALLTALFLAATVTFSDFDSRWSLVWAAVIVTVASILTFGVTFLLMVFFGYELWVRRSIRRSVVIVLVLVAAYLMLSLLFGFDYIESFRLAAFLENADGFRLLSDPVGYFATRIESVAEVIFFFGPYLSYLFVAGLMRYHINSPLMKLALLSMAAFGLTLLTGAYKTGETARAAMFIYPFLLVPVAKQIETRSLPTSDAVHLPFLVFLQTMVMQLTGNYTW